MSPPLDGSIADRDPDIYLRAGRG